MNKTIFFSLFLLFFIQQLFGQSIDSAFTTNGFLPYGGPLSNAKQNSRIGNAMLRQPDGKLVVAENYSGSSDLLLYTYRYNADGTPDTTFGTNGVSGIFCGSDCDNRDLQLQPDGKILVAGATKYCILGVCGALQFVMMRLKTNGELDSTFGNNGKIITTDVFGSTGLYALPQTFRLQSDGKIIVGGRGPAGQPFVARLNNNGFPDSTFGTNGVYSDTTGFAEFEDLAVTDEGNILVLLSKYNYTVGVGYDTTNISDNYLFRLHASGTRDYTFGSAGSLFFSVSNADHPSSLVVKGNHSIVVVGDEQYNNTRNYNWNGTGGNGYGITNRGYIAFIRPDGTMATHIPGGFKSIEIPADSSTFFQKVTVVNDTRLMVSGRIIRKVSGNYQEKAILLQLDSSGNFVNDFHSCGYWVFDYGVTGTSGWPGRLCGFNDVDVTTTNEVFATGYRNPTGGNTATSLFLLKLKDVPTSVIHSPVSTITVERDISFSLYPNPVKDYLLLQTSSNCAYTIYDAVGKVVVNGTVGQGETLIQLPSALPSGLYFMRDNTSGQVAKFVKE